MENEEFDQQVRLEFYRSSSQVVREIGVLAIKTLITLNSGAFVVLLTFIGNTAAQSKFTVPLESLKSALFFFLGGIALSFLVIAYTYIVAQTGSPYPQSPKKTDGWFVPIAVALTGLAFASFLAGVTIVIVGVQTA